LIRDTVAYFQANRVPGFTWWFEQEVSIAHWREDLAAADLHFDNSTPGMALELADLADAPDTPAGLAIRRVTDPDAFRVWCDAFTAGYELPADWAPLIFDGMAPMGFDDPLTHYLGMVDGIPVATASMMLAAGAAGIYNVSTFAPYRGRGFGAAVTTAPLVEARDHGYTTGVLQSSEMGYSVYARMGFVTVCQMEHFYWLAG
jgi:GNAT superfamily N-acetyltransferase